MNATASRPRMFNLHLHLAHDDWVYSTATWVCHHSVPTSCPRRVSVSVINHASSMRLYFQSCSPLTSIICDHCITVNTLLLP